MQSLQIFTLLALTFLTPSIDAMQTLKNKQNIIAQEKLTSLTSAQNAPLEPIFKIESNQCAILIFLDNTTEKDSIGAITIGLLAALEQEAGPIITTHSLLFNIFGPSPQTNNIDNYSNAELMAAYWRSDTQKPALLHCFKFNPNAWSIKKINEDFYLLIPHAYTNQRDINSASLSTFNQTNQLTKEELTLGLKVNHMQTITLAAFATDVPASTALTDVLYNKDSHESAIFCTHRNYYNTGYTQPIWSIYITGHGSMKATIVDMSLEQFKNVLDFLENNITTKLLIYESCYAAGINNEIIYKDSESGVTKTYSFPIITAALTDATTSGVRPLLKEQNNQIIIVHKKDYKKFIQELCSSSLINYESVYSHINASRSRSSKGQGWGNVPQIKFPGIEWFSLLEDKKEIVTITSIMGKTREKPLDVSKFFHTDPKAILLYAKDVPFELIINGYNMQAIISMIPGDALHTIKKISSSTKQFHDIAWWFNEVSDLAPWKTFFIHEINDHSQYNYHDVIIYNMPLTGPQRTETHVSDCYMLYKKDGILFREEFLNPTPTIANSQQATFYESLWDTIKKDKPLNLEIFKNLESQSFKNLKWNNFIIDSLNSLYASIPKMSGVTTIEKIEAPNVSLAEILEHLSNQLSGEGNIVKVKEITGKHPSKSYELETINIPGVQKDQVITITDVIIEKIKRNHYYRSLIYFTYNNIFYQDNTEIKEDYKPKYENKTSAAKQTQDLATPPTTNDNDIESLKKIIEKKASKIQR